MKKDYSKYKWELIIFFSILMFIVSYGLIFNQTIANDDGITRIANGRVYNGNGRFLGVFLTNTIGYGVYNPIITSIFSYCSMLIITITSIKLFEVRRLRTMFAITALVYTYPTFEIYYRFGVDMWLYTLGTALSLLAMYYILKPDKQTYMGILFGAAALAIYQALISVMTIVFTLYYLKKLSKKEVDIKEGLLSLLYLVAAGLVYLVVFKLLLLITGMTVTNYKGASDLSVMSILSGLPANLSIVYRQYINLLLSRLNYYDWAQIPVIWAIFIVTPMLYFYKFVTSNRISNKNKALIVVLILTIPISLFSHVIITSDGSDRTYLAMIFYFIMSAIIFLEHKGKYENIALIIVGLAIFFNLNTILAMETIDLKHMENNRLVTETVITDLQRYDGYDATSKLSVCGHLGYNSNLNYANGYPYVFENRNYLNIQGPSYLVFAKYDDSLEYTKNMTSSMYGLYGLGNEFVNNECDQDAPEYPKEGYIYEKNGIININYSK
ncbi:glucosyltransferase domain-containing protein [Mollicutes bacterium LVI A0078]|nr:glucosyltransferase domain-containing protein [Mollicutes bacterium LVI A0075]WOO91834.1 glucosyltransferase domain-containing protein [Mollicutes bacterium LVI A0078]